MRALAIAAIAVGLAVSTLASTRAAAPLADIERSYEPLVGAIANPERGLYSSIDIVNETELGWFRDEGYTLAHAYVRLDDYRDSAIPDAFLADLSRGLNAARAAGIKIIFRASYNFGVGEADATKDRVLQHIAQFEPIFEQHEDVIAVVQAGFIGAWGEWHSSTNGLTDPAVKAEIRDALLAAVPDTRMVQFRYLPDIETWSPRPLAAEAAYDGSSLARTAHHNDCFLATDDDAGTYWPGNIADHKTYLATASEFLVVGGETCQVGFAENQARRSCAVAEQELARFHWDYLNEDWHEPTLQIWKDQGCWDRITQRLGYRYRLDTSRLPQQVNAGTSLSGEITLSNDGYATLFNKRPVYLVLDGPDRLEIELDTDPRWWSAGATTTIALAEPLPASLAPGNYTVALWLPDALASLRTRSDYAVQMANLGVWDESSGYNRLGEVSVLPATTCTGDVGSRFVDVGAGNTFCADVEWLAETAITRGCNPPVNDHFCPTESVTRAQMAAFLHRALGGTLQLGPAATFTDTSESVFETDISWLSATAITRGCNPPSNNRFCPDDEVTRAQMAAFLVRALDLTAAASIDFIDDDGSIFEADIERLATAGITKGCNPPSNNRFCPNEPVTRSQMAAFLHRALDND